MKSAKSIIKMFKGCKVTHFDIIDGYLHYFRIRTKTGGESTYKFNVEDITYTFKKLSLCAQTPMMWSLIIKERKRADEVRMALMALIDEETIIPPYCMEEARRISQYAKAA